VGSVLGDLEARVMEILWTGPGQTVTEVERRLRASRPIAHTTVLTTLDRMHRKGYLTRRKDGRAFIYEPRFTADEFERSMAEEVLTGLLRSFRTPALSAFIDLVGDDPEVLDRLDALIRARRQSGPKAPP
jgi:predicted transcriptional regulator